MNAHYGHTNRSGAVSLYGRLQVRNHHWVMAQFLVGCETIKADVHQRLYKQLLGLQNGHQNGPDLMNLGLKSSRRQFPPAPNYTKKDKTRAAGKLKHIFSVHTGRQFLIECHVVKGLGTPALNLVHREPQEPGQQSQSCKFRVVASNSGTFLIFFMKKEKNSSSLFLQKNLKTAGKLECGQKGVGQGGTCWRCGLNG